MSSKDKKEKKLVGENIEKCPICDTKNIIKRGKREKKYEIVQLYYCKECKKTFTPQKVKGKHYPLKIILNSLSIYNSGYSLKKTIRIVKEKYGLNLKSSTLNNWVQEFSSLCRYSRLRSEGKKLYSPKNAIPGINLYHRQIYKFRMHRPKLELVFEEDRRNRKLKRLKGFLESMFRECPHYLFKEGGQRVSQAKEKFNMNQVTVREKTNYANRMARLILQTVKDNRKRHEELQKFFIYNDSVTVAVEVPVYMRHKDLYHLEKELDFEIPVEVDDVITGHIDLVQVRNGQVHILDYKPQAGKEKPITQLTLYALALSRLTGLKLFDFKCGWFDKNKYFEFFPLHVVYKLKKRRKKISKRQKRFKLDKEEENKE